MLQNNIFDVNGRGILPYKSIWIVNKLHHQILLKILQVDRKLEIWFLIMPIKPQQELQFRLTLWQLKSIRLL
jgi:hypothetical protein